MIADELIDALLVEYLDEGWMKHMDGTYSADVSDIHGHRGPVHCPKCKDVLGHGGNAILKLGRMATNTDREGEVQYWHGQCCKCDAKIKLWND